MKFTELHIAVVTFHPLEFIFPFSCPVVCVFRGSHERREREKRKEKKKKEREDEKERNKTRENMIDRENMGTRQETKMCIGPKGER